MRAKGVLLKGIIPLVIIIFFVYAAISSIDNDVATSIVEDSNTLITEYEAPTTEGVITINDGIMIFNQDNYLLNIVELMYNFDSYHGMGVMIEGFIVKPQDLGDGSFLLSRYVITCCEDDPELIILDSYYDGNIPPEYTWVKIMGTLQAINYYDESLKRETQKPLIVVDSMEIVPEPEDHFLEP